MNAVQRLRAAGYTRREIAQSLGVTKAAVGFWERGLRFPSRECHGGLVRLAEAKGLRLLAEDFHAEPDLGDEQHRRPVKGRVCTVANT